MSPPRSSPKQTIRLLAGLLLPLVAFVVLVRSLATATEALAMADAIPLLWVLAYGARRRRIEPIGLVAAGGFAGALLLTIASGGSSLPLELHRAVFPGLAGMACLISLALRRPLLSKLVEARPEATIGTRPEPNTPGVRRSLITLTAIIGLTFLTDAATQIILAFTVSTATFGVVARIASWVIIATGLAACALYLHRVRAGRHDHAESAPPPLEPKPRPNRPAPLISGRPAATRAARNARRASPRDVPRSPS